MKKLVSTLTVLSVALLFTACSSDKPDNLPASQTASADKSFTLIAAANNNASGEVTFTLNDFSSITDYVKYINAAVVQTSSFIEIKGITAAQAVELRNVTLSMKSDPNKKIVLPTITANVKFSELPQLTFLQNVMDEMNRRGSSAVVLTYTSTYNLTNPVTLAIMMDARFTFE